MKKGSYPPSKEPLISTREITFGTVMGLGSGFLFKKLGKLILLVIGLGFVSLQLLANQGYVTVHWSRFERRFKDSFDLDGDGKVTVNDAKHGFRALIDLLTKNFQFKSTFIGGFVMGFRSILPPPPSSPILECKSKVKLLLDTKYASKNFRCYIKLHGGWKRLYIR